MFSEQANALQESLQTLSNASIEFIKANRSNDRKEMMKSSTAGMNSLLSTAQIILAYRDGATLAKDRKFTQDSVGLIYESGITENLKQLVLRDKEFSCYYF